MSEHAESTTSPIAAVIMLLVIVGLVVWGIGLMNGGEYVGAGLAGLLLLVTGLVMVLRIGKP